MSEFTLQDVLEDAIEIECKGERLIVVSRDFYDLPEDIDPYITVIFRSGIGDGLWSEYNISIPELLDDPNLKVFHSTPVGFRRGQ